MPVAGRAPAALTKAEFSYLNRNLMARTSLPLTLPTIPNCRAAENALPACAQ
jgi:hypothetical protein